MNLQDLYDLARQENIEVLTFPMERSGSMSVMDDHGACFVGIDKHILDGGVSERVHLSHELGHCMTGSFYNRYAPADNRRRHENRADKWAVKKLIPVQALDAAVADGCTEYWALADRFGVTEEFIRKAVCLYVHGNLATELYF